MREKRACRPPETGRQKADESSVKTVSVWEKKDWNTGSMIDLFSNTPRTT